MSAEQGRTVLRGFVGRSFLEQDEQVWNDVRKVLENLRPFGFDFEDASEAQPRPISKKVKDGIERNDLYIGILTQRFPIFKNLHAEEATPQSATPDRWGTSAWIVQESGYALGKNKRVILLLENGVDFPKSDLDGDQERILFDREDIPRDCWRLASMIGNLVNERVGSILPSSETQVAPPAASPSSEQQTEDQQRNTLDDIFRWIDQNNLERAEREFQNILSDTESQFSKTFLKAAYLEALAVKGHPGRLQALQQLALDNPNNSSRLARARRLPYTFPQVWRGSCSSNQGCGKDEGLRSLLADF